MDKQYEMLKTVLHFHKQALAAIKTGVETAEIFKLPVREEIARAKYIPQDSVKKVAAIRDSIDEHIKQLHPSTV